MILTFFHNMLRVWSNTILVLFNITALYYFAINSQVARSYKVLTFFHNMARVVRIVFLQHFTLRQDITKRQESKLIEYVSNVLLKYDRSINRMGF